MIKMENIRKIQLRELEILLEIDRICKRNNIIYYLSAGTLLGSIRHNGFIPWDDDLDIDMPREDFEKFKKVCCKELSERFWIDCYEYNKKWWSPIIKIRDKNSVYKENSLKKYDDSLCGVWVDIFPLDKSTGSLKKDKIIKIIIDGMKYSMEVRTLDLPINSFSRRNMPLILFFNLLPFKMLHTYMNKIMTCGKMEKKYVSFASTYSIEKMCFNKKDFEISNHIFEKYKFHIPKEYNKILKQIYGDYMILPPKEERNAHGNNKAIFF